MIFPTSNLDPVKLDREIKQVEREERSQRLIDALNKEAPPGKIVSGATQVVILAMARKS